MHYRTPGVDFLSPPDDFLAALGARTEETGNEVVAEELLGSHDDPAVAVTEPPATVSCFTRARIADGASDGGRTFTRFRKRVCVKRPAA